MYTHTIYLSAQCKEGVYLDGEQDWAKDINGVHCIVDAPGFEEGVKEELLIWSNAKRVSFHLESLPFCLGWRLTKEGRDESLISSFFLPPRRLFRKRGWYKKKTVFFNKSQNHGSTMIHVKGSFLYWRREVVLISIKYVSCIHEMDPVKIACTFDSYYF